MLASEDSPEASAASPLMSVATWDTTNKTRCMAMSNRSGTKIRRSISATKWPLPAWKALAAACLKVMSSDTKNTTVKTKRNMSKVSVASSTA